MEAGSQEALEEQKWMNQAKSRADELEHDFALLLPQISFNDRLTLDLGDCTMTLHWFGETGNYRGLTMAVIPEKKLAILSKSIIFPVYHLAPYPLPAYGVLDIPRWIALMEEILEGENAVSNILLSDYDQVISRDLMQSHLDYIRKLWSSVKSLEAEGKNLQEIQDHLTFEKDFAFVKEMQVYINQGDFWIRLQHELHIKLFFLQGKNLASEIIKEGGIDSLQASLDKIRSQRADLYFDEELIHRIAYVWMQMDNAAEAMEVFKLNTEAFPQSFNVHLRLAEAYTEVGDTNNAIKSYERSLKLDPDNDRVKQALIELRN